MTQEVRSYFAACHALDASAGAIGTKLARGGIADMDALCALLEEYPDKLLAIRNIGPKSMAVIRGICEVYRSERGDAL